MTFDITYHEQIYDNTSEIFYNWERKKWPFNTYNCLIEMGWYNRTVDYIWLWRDIQKWDPQRSDRFAGQKVGRNILVFWSTTPVFRKEDAPPSSYLKQYSEIVLIIMSYIMRNSIKVGRIATPYILSNYYRQILVSAVYKQLHKINGSAWNKWQILISPGECWSIDWFGYKMCTNDHINLTIYNHNYLEGIVHREKCRLNWPLCTNMWHLVKVSFYVVCTL